ncbi:MAG: hypothetical protein WC631_03395 [Candidatus Paceibacterota bacterium]|jgi:hypothetical protein
MNEEVGTKLPDAEERERIEKSLITVNREIIDLEMALLKAIRDKKDTSTIKANIESAKKAKDNLERQMVGDGMLDDFPM